MLCIPLLLAGARLAAQSLPADSLFDRLVGHWVLRGTIAGQSTTHDVAFDWMLGREYVQMHEVSRERTPDGAPVYEAVVLFGRDPRSGEYACLWLDNTGSGGLKGWAIGHGKRDGDTIPFLFKGGDGSPFHNTFVYDRRADSWRWAMDNEQDGKLVPFARA